MWSKLGTHHPVPWQGHVVVVVVVSRGAAALHWLHGAMPRSSMQQVPLTARTTQKQLQIVDVVVLTVSPLHTFGQCT
jgi:hypothetical protein